MPSAVTRAVRAWMLWPKTPRCALQQVQNRAVCVRAPGANARRQPFPTVVGLSALALRCARRELTWQNRGRYVRAGSFSLACACGLREHPCSRAPRGHAVMNLKRRGAVGTSPICSRRAGASSQNRAAWRARIDPWGGICAHGKQPLAATPSWDLAGRLQLGPEPLCARADVQIRTVRAQQNKQCTRGAGERGGSGA